MIHKVKEVDHGIKQPYNSKDSVKPKAGDIINITLLNGKESTVICVNDNNAMSGGYKGDTCKHYCALGRAYTPICVHLPLKCNDDIMFKNIDDVLENL